VVYIGRRMLSGGKIQRAALAFLAWAPWPPASPRSWSASAAFRRRPWPPCACSWPGSCSCLFAWATCVAPGRIGVFPVSCPCWLRAVALGPLPVLGAGTAAHLGGHTTFIFSLNPVFFSLAQRFGARRRLPAYARRAWGWAWPGRFGCCSWGAAGLAGGRPAGAGRLFAVRGLPAGARRFAGEMPHLAFAQTIYFWGGLAGLPVALLSGSLRAVSPGTPSPWRPWPGWCSSDPGRHTAMNFGVRHLSPLTVSFFSLAEPIVATTAAAVFLGSRCARGSCPLRNAAGRHPAAPAAVGAAAGGVGKRRGCAPRPQV